MTFADMKVPSREKTEGLLALQSKHPRVEPHTHSEESIEAQSAEVNEVACQTEGVLVQLQRGNHSQMYEILELHSFNAPDENQATSF